MLGKTAGGLFWMFRYLERSENLTRLIDAGFRIALTRSAAAGGEWASLVNTAGAEEVFEARHDTYNAANVPDFLLRDRANPSSVMSVIEQARNTARILDVKYDVLLPSIAHVGSALDNVQRETILRSVSAHRSYCWLNGGDINPVDIADFLIPDRRMPRSLALCAAKIGDNLGYLEQDYALRHPSHDTIDAVNSRLKANSIGSIMEFGLHEFLTGYIADNARLGHQIEQDFRFYG